LLAKNILQILAVILLLSSILSANVFELTSKMEGLSTGSSLSFFEDKTKKMGIEEIKNTKFKQKNLCGTIKGLVTQIGG